MNDKNKKNWINPRRFYRRRQHRYEPFYDEHADYNTNAPSYYDYLARFNKFLIVASDFINRLIDRDIDFNNTNSINFTKKGDWIDNGECEPNNYDDVLKISAVVNISNSTESKKLDYIDKNYTINNGTKVKNDGVWSPDYFNILEDMDNEFLNLFEKLTSLENTIINQQNKINSLENALQKIIDNLYNSGAITDNNIDDFDFNSGRNIATGNINLFGGTSDGNSFIRTNNGKSNNDISAGY